MPPPGKRKKSVVSKRPTKPTPTGRSGAATKQFKASVRKARVKGIDTRSPETKKRDFEKEARERAQAGGDGRSQALQKAALQPTIDKNKFLAEQEQRRKDILAGKVIPKKSDFTGFEGGIMGIRAGDFTDTGLPKIREGMTSDQYAEFMQKLYRRNPALMEKYFPVASGKALNQLMQFAPGIGTLGRIAKSAFGKARDVGSGIGSKISSGIGGLLRPRFGQFFRPASSVNANLQDQQSSGGGGGIMNVAQSAVDSIYGSRIGRPGMGTMDFVDSDGDGVDDRYQTGPGQPRQELPGGELKKVIGEIGGMPNQPQIGLPFRHVSSGMQPTGAITPAGALASPIVQSAMLPGIQPITQQLQFDPNTITPFYQQGIGSFRI